VDCHVIGTRFLLFLMVSRFLELGSALEPGKPVKADKAAILSDATRMVIQLRSESQQLKETNGSLEEKIKELKVIQLLLVNTVNSLTYKTLSFYGASMPVLFLVNIYESVPVSSNSRPRRTSFATRSRN
jgi:hypothetical protein